MSEEFNEVWKSGRQIKLSDLEYRILKLLMNKRNKIFSAQNIYESVWGQPYFYCSNNTVMVHIRKPRAKIEDDPARPVYIKTEWGEDTGLAHRKYTLTKKLSLLILVAAIVSGVVF